MNLRVQITLLSFSILVAGCSHSNPTTSEKTLREIKSSPIGDNSHSEIYNFIGDEIAKYKSATRAEALEVLEDERRAEKTIGSEYQLKPMSASFYEWEFSDILQRLCATHKGCIGLGIYAKNGSGIALAGEGLPSVLTVEDGWETLQQNNADPIIKPLTTTKMTDAEKNTPNNLMSVTYPVYQSDNTSYPYSLSQNDNDHKPSQLIGFVVTIKDLTKLD